MLLASYVMFKERIKVLQMAGIVVILISVVIVAMFSYDEQRKSEEGSGIG